MTEADEFAAVPGEGPRDRRVAALRAIEAIVDPCSRALGKPVGLVGMGIVDRLDVEGGRVAVRLFPTFPTCMFRGVFEEEIENRLRGLSWCEIVTVSYVPSDAIWDEGRLSEAARGMLGRSPKPAATDERRPLPG